MERAPASAAARALVACGLASTLLYLGIDALGALSYPGYDYAAQTISEMSAVGAPTRTLLAPLYLLYTVLLIAFAFGVRAAAGGKRRLRITGALLAAVGFVGLAGAFFPMQMRGNAPTFTDLMHVAYGGVNSLLLLLAIAFGAPAFGRPLRLYSLAPILVMIASGAGTFLLAPAVAIDALMPYLGIVERFLFASFLLWIAALSAMLLRRSRARGPAIVDLRRGALPAGVWRSVQPGGQVKGGRS